MIVLVAEGLVLGGHKYRGPSTSVDIPTSTLPTRPFVVPGPPPFPEGFAYSASYALRSNMFPHIQYQFQAHETAMNNSIAQDPVVPQQPSNTQSAPQSVVPRTESSSSQITLQASNISKVYVEPEGDGFQKYMSLSHPSLEYVVDIMVMLVIEMLEVYSREIHLPNTSVEGDGAGCTAEQVEVEEPTQAIKEVEAWKEFVGLTKKAKIYGLGLHGSTFKDSSSDSQKSTDTSCQKSLPVVDTPEFKTVVAKVASKVEEVQKANEEEEKEKEMERLKKKNKRLKQKVNILFEKFNMAPLRDSDPNDNEDKCS
ncbi:hypothetical protein Cgig2_031586 [Carnegiea gigantea]|uniref:Uncharacterized protein n=1 Tax=Carnegiea gigantea TaxID=171969 RepID=A0A9Q1GRM0_9CARY|nr:hypothetical protein Cgig2_031586 [Carnegiea gigantea]